MGITRISRAAVVLSACLVGSSNAPAAPWEVPGNVVLKIDVQSPWQSGWDQLPDWETSYTNAGGITFTMNYSEVRERGGPSNSGDFTYADIFNTLRFFWDNNNEYGGLQFGASGLNTAKTYDAYIWHYDHDYPGRSSTFYQVKDGADILLGEHTYTHNGEPDPFTPAANNDSCGMVSFMGLAPDASGAVTFKQLNTVLGWPSLSLSAFALVEVVPPLAGDTDLDKDVDFTDYQHLEASFGTTTGATWEMGDFNGNGAVEFTDYQLLESNFGTGVPEPATLGLLAVGLIGLVRRR